MSLRVNYSKLLNVMPYDKIANIHHSYFAQRMRFLLHLSKYLHIALTLRATLDGGEYWFLPSVDLWIG